MLRAAGKNTDVDAFAQAANRLFETSAAEEPAPPRKKRCSAAPMQDTLPQNAIRTRSLEVIEKTERRRKRTADPRRGMQNPYHRCFTQDRTFEELARKAREMQKNPPKEP